MKFTIIVALLGAMPAVTQATVVNDAPDYRQESAWLCRPGRADACAADQRVTIVAADGTLKPELFYTSSKPEFDCFYVYPTVSLDPTPNSDMIAGKEERGVAGVQAARFTSHCRVFAPLYRQVTLVALRSIMQGKPVSPDRAMALADVTAAWRDYLERDNHGRGVVLIGHSQGSTILKSLLSQTIEGHPAQKLLISALLPGTNLAVPRGKLVGGELKSTPLCTRSSQTGCVIAYVSFRADSPPPANSRFGRASSDDLVVACTNPAALGGGKAVSDAIFPTVSGFGSAPAPKWTATNSAPTTPFVRTPGLITTECRNTDGASYLAVTVNSNRADPRTDTISGDVVVGDQILRDWGLHLLDMPVAMGNLVALTETQATAWRKSVRR